MVPYAGLACWHVAQDSSYKHTNSLALAPQEASEASTVNSGQELVLHSHTDGVGAVTHGSSRSLLVTCRRPTPGQPASIMLAFTLGVRTTWTPAPGLLVLLSTSDFIALTLCSSDTPPPLTHHHHHLNSVEACWLPKHVLLHCRCAGKVSRHPCQKNSS